MILHPGIIMILFGIIIPFLPGVIKKAAMVAVPSLVAFLIYNFDYGQSLSMTFINNIELVYFNVDRLSWVFLFVMSLVVISANIYALRVNNPVELASQSIYVGGAFGVLLAGDWLTLIFFWELMAISSVFLVWSKKDEKSKKAGFRYLLVHFMGGNLLLAGIFLKVSQGEYLISSLTNNMDLAAIFIFLGVAVNAAIYPLHAWIPDAYPQGTITGSVFMSFLTTKVAVYTLVRVFPGLEILIWLGCIMALIAVAYAILANDIRLIFSYHIVSQLGYMVAAAGLGTELAINGSVSHAISNILYKSLLFMGAGAIMYSTGRNKMSELGGLFKRKPLLTILFLIGSLAISGFPLLNGFTTKAVILSAASLAKYPLVELLLYLASVGTLVSTCLKFIFFAFMGEPGKEYDLKPVPINMYVAMSFNSVLCFAYGIFPNLLYNRLPFEMNYVAYTFDHVLSTLQILLAATFTFVLILELMKPKDIYLIDIDWFYRVPLAKGTLALSSLVVMIQEKTGGIWLKGIEALYPIFRNPLKWLEINEDSAKMIEDYNENYYRFPVGAAVTISLIIFISSYLYISM